MIDSAIEKFMERMGIYIRIAVFREYISSRGKKNICVGLTAYYKDDPTYVVYHCYEITNTGLMTWDESNLEMGVRDGIFRYLGDDSGVDDYFKKKTYDYLVSELGERFFSY